MDAFLAAMGVAIPDAVAMVEDLLMLSIVMVVFYIAILFLKRVVKAL